MYFLISYSFVKCD